MKNRKKCKGSGILGPLLIIAIIATYLAFCGQEMQEKLHDWIWNEQSKTKVITGSLPDRADNCMEVHYLDVGKCNCVLVRSGDGHDMMIDAGCNGREHEKKITEYLRQKGVTKLTYLVLTHPHMDHIYAVPKILEEFEVDEVLMGDHDPDIVGTKTFQRLLAAIEEKDPVVTRPSAGDVYTLGRVTFMILAHDDSRETALEDLNNCSIALMVTDGVHRFLFYGDGEEKVENAMLADGYELSADVLMVSHHGSFSSSSQKLVETVQPAIAVISSGLDLDGVLQEPSEQVLKRLESVGARIFRSDVDGTVVVYSQEEGLFTMCEE